METTLQYKETFEKIVEGVGQGDTFMKGSRPSRWAHKLSTQEYDYIFKLKTLQSWAWWHRPLIPGRSVHFLYSRTAKLTEQILGYPGTKTQTPSLKKLIKIKLLKISPVFSHWLPHLVKGIIQKCQRSFNMMSNV